MQQPWHRRLAATIITTVGTLALTAALGASAQAFPGPDARPLCGNGAVEAPVLNLTFRTGSDDLRGNTQDIFLNDDNLHLILTTRFGSHRIDNINLGQNWPNGSTRLVQVCLTQLRENDPAFPSPRPLTLDDVNGVRLLIDGGSDAWNLDALTATWSTALTQTIFQASGAPLFRFSANQSTFDLRPVGNLPGPLFDGGFEGEPSHAITAPWWSEGIDGKGIDINAALSGVGRNNAYVWSGARRWNAVLQNVPVFPNTEYLLTGMVRTSAGVNTGFFGARVPGIWPPPGERHFGHVNDGRYHPVQARFNTRNNTVITVFCGLWGMDTPGGDWVQVDDIRLVRLI